LIIKKEIFKKIPENILNKEAINKLENKGVKIVDVLGKGHRGVVLKGIYNNKEVAIKIPRTDSPKNTIENEAKFLKLLEKYDIAPKVYEFDNNYLIMEFIDGEELKSAVDKLDKDRLLKVVEDILKITLKLDILRIEHKEIQGGRHFLITDKKTYIIDFDKAKEKKTTKNFTGAVALLFGEGRIAKTIREKLNIEIDEIKFIREFAKTYKKLQ
jgi:putative serine/threonine protein kinase